MSRAFKVGLGNTTKNRREAHMQRGASTRSDKLAMRRGRSTAVVPLAPQKKAPIVVFRELKTHTLSLLTQAYAAQDNLEVFSAAMESLQDLLHFPDDGVVMTIYPELFGGDEGTWLLTRMAFIIAAEPGKLPQKLIEATCACLTTIMFEPQNLACVEILAGQQLHVHTLRHLVPATPSSVRYDLLEMLGNMARNNRYARDIVLNTPDFLPLLVNNMRDALEKGDLSLISGIIYVLFSVCDSEHGGETPPLGMFSEMMPLLLTVIEQSRAVSPVEWPQHMEEIILGLLAFFEAISLADGAMVQAAQDLMVARLDGVTKLSETPAVMDFLKWALTLQHSFRKKAISTISFMCSAGADVCRNFLAIDVIPQILLMLNNGECDEYTLRQAYRVFFLFSKYGNDFHKALLAADVHKVVAQQILSKQRNIDVSVMRFGVWMACKLGALDMGVADMLVQSIPVFLNTGDRETLEAVLGTLVTFTRAAPREMKLVLDQVQTVSLMSRIMHVAHPQTDLFQSALYIQNGYQ